MGQQSQVEQWEESDTQFALQNMKCVVVWLGSVGVSAHGAEEPGTLGPAIAAQLSSAQLRVPPAARLSQRWWRFGGNIHSESERESSERIF